MPQFRKNPLTQEWVIVATERAKRPNDYSGIERVDLSGLPEWSAECPFCPGNEAKTPPEVLGYRKQGEANSSGWWVRAVPNRFPALAVEGGLNRAGVGLYDTMNGIGAHEVIVETPLHNRSLAYLDETALQDVAWAWRDRYLDLRRDNRFKYIMIFRNHGRVAGASLVHSHSQLIATPIVPIEIEQELEGMRRYRDFHERCLLCDVVVQELYDGARVVLENQKFVVVVPFAARFPFGLSIIPKRHQASFADMQRDEIEQFASVLKGALLKVDACLNFPPYNFSLHTAPADLERSEEYHWRVEIMPRLTVAAGFEMGTGIHINVTVPEEAAEYLRRPGPGSPAQVPSSAEAAVSAPPATAGGPS